MKYIKTLLTFFTIISLINPLQGSFLLAPAGTAETLLRISIKDRPIDIDKQIAHIVALLSNKLGEGFIGNYHYGLRHSQDLIEHAKQLAAKLGKTSAIDWKVLTAAICLHDLGAQKRPPHGEASADYAEKILREIDLFTKDDIGKIQQAIILHDERKVESPVRRKQAGLEAQILFDIDNWNAFGIQGIYRYIAVYCVRGEDLDYIKKNGLSSARERYDSLEFSKTKALGKADFEVIEDFFKKLADEKYNKDHPLGATGVVHFISQDPYTKPTDIAATALKVLDGMNEKFQVDDDLVEHTYVFEFFTKLESLYSESSDSEAPPDRGTIEYFNVFDPTKPRIGKTAQDVVARFEELRRLGFEGFTPVTQETPFVKEATNYYTKIGDLSKVQRINDLIEHGSLRAGIDEKNVFYGANDDSIYLIATNDIANPTATLIYELNEGTQEENESVELGYLEYVVCKSPLGSGLIEKNKSVFRAHPDLRPHFGKVHSLRIWRELEGLAERFLVNKKLLLVVAFLHDIGIVHGDIIQHGWVSAEDSEATLMGIAAAHQLSQEESAQILTAIKEHDDYTVTERSILSQLLFYAESREAFGAQAAESYLTAARKLGMPDHEFASGMLSDIEKRFHCVSDPELKELLRTSYEFSKRYFTQLASDTAGEGKRKLTGAISLVPELDNPNQLVKIIEHKLLERGLAPCSVQINVTIPKTNSSRIECLINIVLNDDSAETIFSFYVKTPINDMEKNRALYASKVGLGPNIVYTDDHLIIEYALDEQRDIRHLGMSLTEEEAEVLGHKLARALHRMVVDNVVLYQSNTPATHIIVSGLGTVLEPKFINWSESADLSNLADFNKSSIIEGFIKQMAYLMRSGLSVSGPSMHAWRSFTQTIADPAWVTDATLRNELKAVVQKVEDKLCDVQIHDGDSSSAERWKSFFSLSRAVSILKEIDTQYLRSMLLVDEDTPLSEVKNSLILKLEGVGITDTACSIAIINDIIKNLEIDSFFGVSKLELKKILTTVLSKKNIPDEEISTVYEIIIEAIELNDTDMITSRLVHGILRIVLRKMKTTLGLQDSDVTEINEQVFTSLQEIELKKINFELTKGVIGGNRPWANHLNVLGPGPERSILITYNIKATHSPLPYQEISRSHIASDLKLGPRFIYGNAEKGVIVEQWLGDNEIGKRAPGLSRPEKLIAARRLAEKYYRMFDLRRERRVIHKFDNLPHHLYVVGEHESIDILFIDWGKGEYVHESNRKQLMHDHMQSIISQIKQHLGSQAMAHFIFRLNVIAQTTSQEEYDFYRDSYNDVQTDMTTTGHFKVLNKAFFDDANALLNELEMEGSSPAQLSSMSPLLTSQ